MAKAHNKFDPFKFAGVKRPKDPALREEAMEAMGEFLRDSILEHVSKSKSPVKGGKFNPRLSPGYKSVKAGQASSSKANLELSGAMLDALEFRVEGNSLNIGVFDTKQVGKAEGNNLGTYGGKVKRAKNIRRFIPVGRQKFNKTIKNGMRDIALEVIGDDE